MQLVTCLLQYIRNDTHPVLVLVMHTHQRNKKGAHMKHVKALAALLAEIKNEAQHEMQLVTCLLQYIRNDTYPALVLVMHTHKRNKNEYI